MHIFMDAIGLSQVRSRTDIEKLVQYILESPDEKYITEVENGILLAEIRKNFAKDIGVTLVGEYDKEQNFRMSHYYPYLKGSLITTEEDITINRKIDTDAFTGMCDDLRLGISLIFYLRNPIAYLNFRRKQLPFKPPVPISLSALSIQGKILLGNQEDPFTGESIKKWKTRRNSLLREAKTGNMEAINQLTIDDIDMYASISRRLLHEDLYSIVSTSFIPYGSESDNYTVLGKIQSVETITNSFTNERSYLILLECNEIVFPLIINQKQLVGEPVPGRRFKGVIWLQGAIQFPDTKIL